jgi:hypothetical protein
MRSWRPWRAPVLRRSSSVLTVRGITPAEELYKIRLLGLPPAAEKLVLGGNLLRLIGG